MQYGGWCAVRIRQIIRKNKGVQDRTTKTAKGIVGGCTYLL